ncbi:MAG: hypothetical protein R8K47_03600 [Mariprofundaceae bacterium]
MNPRTAAATDMEMNPDELWREELYTDLRLGTIRRLVPVTAEGEPDPNRKVRYSGEARIMTPAGMLPLSFEIPAETLAEAAAGFGKAAEKAIEETARELEELRRETASGIVMPGAEDIGRISGGGGAPGTGGLLKP